MIKNVELWVENIDMTINGELSIRKVVLDHESNNRHKPYMISSFDDSSWLSDILPENNTEMILFLSSVDLIRLYETVVQSDLDDNDKIYLGKKIYESWPDDYKEYRRNEAERFEDSFYWRIAQEVSDWVVESMPNGHLFRMDIEECRGDYGEFEGLYLTVCSSDFLVHDIRPEALPKYYDMGYMSIEY